MNLMMAILSSLGGVSPITISSHFFSDLGASPVSSSSKTLTVPSGNPGNVRFEITSNDGTLEYKKNTDPFATVTDGMVVAFATGNSLQFKFTSGSPGDGCGVQIYDDTTDTLISAWSATIL